MINEFTYYSCIIGHHGDDVYIHSNDNKIIIIHYNMMELMERCL